MRAKYKIARSFFFLKVVCAYRNVALHISMLVMILLHSELIAKYENCCESLKLGFTRAVDDIAIIWGIENYDPKACPFDLTICPCDLKVRVPKITQISSVYKSRAFL